MVSFKEKVDDIPQKQWQMQTSQMIKYFSRIHLFFLYELMLVHVIFDSYVL